MPSHEITANDRQSPSEDAGNTGGTRRKKWLIALVVLMGLGIAWFTIGQPFVRKIQLRSAASSADRVVFLIRAPAKSSDLDRYVFSDLTLTIKGRDKVDELLQLIELKSYTPGVRCMCSGDTRLQFANGTEVLATLSIHHDKTLRWWDGPWLGDAGVSRKAIEDIRGFREKEGGESLVELGVTKL